MALFKELIVEKNDHSIIPALQRNDKTWVFSGVHKSNILAKEFATNGKLRERLINEYSNKWDYGEVDVVQGFWPIRERHVAYVVKILDEDSSTGPDLLSTKILKNCVKSLTRPITMLARKMWNTGVAGFMEISLGTSITQKGNQKRC